MLIGWLSLSQFCLSSDLFSVQQPQKHLFLELFASSWPFRCLLHLVYCPLFTVRHCTLYTCHLSDHLNDAVWSVWSLLLCHPVEHPYLVCIVPSLGRVLIQSLPVTATTTTTTKFLSLLPARLCANETLFCPPKCAFSLTGPPVATRRPPTRYSAAWRRSSRRCSPPTPS